MGPVRSAAKNDPRSTTEWHSRSSAAAQLDAEQEKLGSGAQPPLLGRFWRRGGDKTEIRPDLEGILLELGNALPELGLMLRPGQWLAVLQQTLTGCRQNVSDESGCVGLLLVEGEPH